jgi:hypothetical protein
MVVGLSKEQLKLPNMCLKHFIPILIICAFVIGCFKKIDRTACSLVKANGTWNYAENRIDFELNNQGDTLSNIAIQENKKIIFFENGFGQLLFNQSKDSINWASAEPIVSIFNFNSKEHKMYSILFSSDSFQKWSIRPSKIKTTNGIKFQTGILELSK